MIDPASGVDGLRDVLLAGGAIEAVEPPGQIRAPLDAEVVEAGPWWIVPGLIDAHAHLRDPGFPHKETIASGLRAAAAGGFTAVAAMANTSPPNDSPDVTRYMLERARPVRATRLVPVSAVTIGLKGRELVDCAAMVDAGARLFSDDGATLDDPAVLARACREIGKLDRAISLHEEERGPGFTGAINAGVVARLLGVRGIPAEAESERVRRDLAITDASGASIHIAHVSTAQSLELIRAAKRRGSKVTCEVTPHHFALDEEAVLRWGPCAKMAPPLRSKGDVEAVRAAIADGTVDLIATDHAPHDAAAKNLHQLAGLFRAAAIVGRLAPGEVDALETAANGIIGLETALGLGLALVHSGLITASRLVELMSLNPAVLLRVDGGQLRPGAAADVTVIDPNLTWTVEPDKFLSLSRNTPFAGMRLRGRAVMTIVAGEIVSDARSASEVR